MCVRVHVAHTWYFEIRVQDGLVDQEMLCCCTVQPSLSERSGCEGFFSRPFPRLAELPSHSLAACRKDGVKPGPGEAALRGW